MRSLALTAALILSGCVPIKILPDTSGEQINNRWVQLDFGVCAYTGELRNCVSGTRPESVAGALIAIRAPKRTGLPYQISSVSGTTITLTRNRSYTQQLNELAPHGANARWFGYRSASAAPQPIMNTYFEVQMNVPGDFAHDEFGVTPAAGSATVGLATEIDCGLDLLGTEGNARCITDPTEGNFTKTRIPLTLTE